MSPGQTLFHLCLAFHAAVRRRYNDGNVLFVSIDIVNDGSGNDTAGTPD